MQSQSRMDRELLDAGEMAGHLVPSGSVFAFLAEHRRELFPASFTADLFPSGTARPPLPADLVRALGAGAVGCSAAHSTGRSPALADAPWHSRAPGHFLEMSTGPLRLGAR